MMADNSSHINAAFKYPPLTDASRQIRLIEVHEQSGPSNIPCISIWETLIAFTDSHFKVRSYDAISYTWGELEPKERIYIKNRITQDDSDVTTLIVRKNCADVLRQLSHFGTSRYYWLDAICINQEDDAERAQQVEIMGQIFSKAHCVLACIGMHRDDSEFMAQILGRFEAFMTAGHVSTIDLAIEPENRDLIIRECSENWSECFEARFFRRYFEWFDRVDAATFERLFRALDRLARRPYFWRIWILQELYLASRLRIFCGTSELSLSALLFWWRDVRYMAISRESPSTSTTKMGQIFEGKLSSHYIQRALWRDPTYFAEHGGSGLGTTHEHYILERLVDRSDKQLASKHLMAPYYILKMCEYRECQDPRDCIYGTLALCEWQTSISLCESGKHIEAGPIVRPDYTISAFQLAKALLPSLHDVPQLNRLTMGMLALSHSDPEVQTGLKSRGRRFPDFKLQRNISPRRITTETQKLVHIVEGGFQVTSESPWSLRQETVGSKQYTKVLDSNTRCCAITTSSVYTGDWLVPTHYGRGFVLRKCGDLYAFVAKALFSSEFMDNDFGLVAFMIWYDPDDLLVHLVGGLRGLSAYEIDSPSEETVEQLGIGMCASENSSFGQLTSVHHCWPASMFEFNRENVCNKMVRECYADNY